MPCAGRLVAEPGKHVCTTVWHLLKLGQQLEMWPADVGRAAGRAVLSWPGAQGLADDAARCVSVPGRRCRTPCGGCWACLGRLCRPPSP